MKKEGFYKIIIVCLLLLNAGILLYLWLGLWPKHGHRPDRMIIERLKLDEGQQQQFQVLRNEHHEQMMYLQEEGGRLHHQLFGLLQQEPPDSNMRNSLLQQIQQVDLKREQVTFEHFEKLRGILRPEQKPLFDAFVDELGRQLMTQPPPQGPPPPDKP